MNTLSIEELSVGMVISDNIYDPKTKKLLLKSHTKLTESLINSLKMHKVTQANIAERYTLFIDPVDTTKTELLTLLTDAINKTVPQKAEANPSDSITEVASRCIRIVQEILEEDIIVEFCVQMKLSDNEYLFKHCINTCAISLLVAGSMELRDWQLKNIGTAALIHDLGMCEMPSLIRVESRNKQEETLWQEHSRYGYYFALEKGINEVIAKIILHHHEKWNGDGFPEKLSGENIPLGSRIICVCETYDELIHLQKMPNYQAIEQLYGGGNYFYDTNVVKAFTNNLAVYPLGSLVRLTTGEVGVVVNVRKNLGPRPVVKVFFNRVNRPLLAPKEIDLGAERTTFISEILS